MTDQAALYTSRVVSLGPFLREIEGVEQIQINQEGSRPPTQYRFQVNRVQVTLNLMPASQLASHLDGFCGYLRHLHATHPSSHTDPLIAKIQTVKTVLGCVVEPGWDDEGQVTGILLMINEDQDGLIFVNNSVIGPDGTPLVGPMADPPN
jgi:hypothetical protein